MKISTLPAIFSTYCLKIRKAAQAAAWRKGKMTGFLPFVLANMLKMMCNTQVRGKNYKITREITEAGNHTQEVSAALHAEYVFIFLGVVAMTVALMLYRTLRK